MSGARFINFAHRSYLAEPRVPGRHRIAVAVRCEDLVRTVLVGPEKQQPVPQGEHVGAGAAAIAASRVEAQVPTILSVPGLVQVEDRRQ